MTPIGRRLDVQYAENSGDPERGAYEDGLVRRARRGDAAALAELLRRHDDQLRRLAFQLLEDPERIDDTMQEAYLRAFRGLPGFKGRAALSTWLYRLTYNACLDELRRSRRRPPAVSLDEIADPPAAGLDPGEVLSYGAEVRAALMELPPDYRAVVWLVDAMGFDYAEAATILATRTGTVASRLNRARAALRATLAPTDPEPES